MCSPTSFKSGSQAAVRFEREHSAMIHDFDFKCGDLVLVRNTAIEKSLNRKMCTHYLGPLVVISHKGSAYIISELNGSVFNRPVAAFRVNHHPRPLRHHQLLDRDMERAQSNGDDDNDEADVEPELEVEDELNLTLSDLDSDTDD
jgi:hypothetical protein